MGRRKTKAEARIFLIPERLLDRETAAVQLNYLRRRQVGAIGRQTPRLLHARGLHAHDGPHRRAIRSHVRVSQNLRAPVLRHPFSGRLRVTLGALDEDVLSKADHETPAEHRHVPIAPGATVVVASIEQTHVGEMHGTDMTKPYSLRSSRSWFSDSPEERGERIAARSRNRYPTAELVAMARAGA